MSQQLLRLASQSASFFSALAITARKSLGGIERKARGNAPQRITCNEARNGAVGDGCLEFCPGDLQGEVGDAARSSPK